MLAIKLMMIYFKGCSVCMGKKSKASSGEVPEDILQAPGLRVQRNDIQIMLQSETHKFFAQRVRINGFQFPFHCAKLKHSPDTCNGIQRLFGNFFPEPNPNARR
jgi:hypothetical protein